MAERTIKEVLKNGTPERDVVSEEIHFESCQTIYGEKARRKIRKA